MGSAEEEEEEDMVEERDEEMTCKIGGPYLAYQASGVLLPSRGLQTAPNTIPVRFDAVCIASHCPCHLGIQLPAPPGSSALRSSDHHHLLPPASGSPLPRHPALFLHQIHVFNPTRTHASSRTYRLSESPTDAR